MTTICVLAASSLTAILVTRPQHGLMVLYGNGSFRYTPSLGFCGTDSFQYKANDGSSTSNVATVTITVNDEGPQLSLVGYQVTSTWSLLNLPEIGTFTHASEPGDFSYQIDWGDGTTPDKGTATIVDPGSGVTPLVGVINGAQHVYIVAGYHEVAVTVTDPQGLSDTESLIVIVNQSTRTQPSQAPQGTFGTANITAGSPYCLQVADFGFTDPNDNPPNNFVAVEVTTLPTSGSLTLSGSPVTAGQFVTVGDLEAGNLVFTPAAGIPHPSFTFQVEDDGNTFFGGQILDPDPKTLTFNATPVDQDDSYSVYENQTLDQSQVSAPGVVSVLQNDTDADGDSLTAVLMSGPQSGTLSFQSDGGFVYTPNVYFTGTDSFQYEATDGNADSNVATVTVTVVPTHQAPSGTSGTVSIPSSAPYPLTMADFGFTDPHDSPPDNFAQVEVTTLPTAGTLLLDGAAVTAGQFVNVADLSAGNLVFARLPLRRAPVSPSRSRTMAARRTAARISIPAPRR